MAGSYNHIVNKKGEFIGCELLDDLGDGFEALEECYWMIHFLAGGDRKKIEAARLASRTLARKHPYRDREERLEEE